MVDVLLDCISGCIIGIVFVLSCYIIKSYIHTINNFKTINNKTEDEYSLIP
jgi:hypothetical protein